MSYFFGQQTFMSETAGLPINEYSAFPEEPVCFDERLIPGHASTMMDPSTINPNLLISSQDALLVPSSSQQLWTPLSTRSRSVTPSEILHDASSVLSTSPHAPSVYLEEPFGPGSGSHTPPEPYMSAAPGAFLTQGNPALYDGSFVFSDYTQLSVGHPYQTSPFIPNAALEAASTQPSFHAHPSSSMMNLQTSSAVNSGIATYGATHVLPFVQHPAPQLSMPLPVVQPQLHQRPRHQKGSMSAALQGSMNPSDIVSPSIARHRRFASTASAYAPSPLLVQSPSTFSPQNPVPRPEEQYIASAPEVSHAQHDFFNTMQINSARSSISSSIPSRYSIAHSADVDESGSSAYSPYTPHTRNGSLSTPFSAITVTGMSSATGYSPTIAPTAIVGPTSTQSATMGSEAIVQSLPLRENNNNKRASIQSVHVASKINEEDEEEDDNDDSEDEYQLRHEEEEESADDEYVLPSGSDKRRRRKTGNEASGRGTKRARGLSGAAISRHPSVGGKTLPNMEYASLAGGSYGTKKLPAQSGSAGRDNNVKYSHLPLLTKDMKKCPVCSFSPSNGRYSDMKRHYDSHRMDGDKCKGIWVTAECGTFEERELSEAELATTWNGVEGLVDGRKKVVFTLNCSREGCKTYTRKDSAKRHWRQSHANSDKEWSDDFARLVHEVVRPSLSASMK